MWMLGILSSHFMDGPERKSPRGLTHQVTALSQLPGPVMAPPPAAPLGPAPSTNYPFQICGLRGLGTEVGRCFSSLESPWAPTK